MIIRKAKEADLIFINEIYNQSVDSQISTADMYPSDMDGRREWFESHDKDKYPVYVAEKGDVLIGWVSLSAYRPGREALRFTAEVSYYVHQDYQKKGIGSGMLEFILGKAPDYNIKNVFAILLDTNIGSIKLLEKFKFQKWGHLPDIADFNGRECGQFYYGVRV